MNEMVQYGFGLLITILILGLLGILRLEYKEDSTGIVALIAGMLLGAWIFILLGMEAK